jgi:glycosyltransferase involved in cell wall biosynthesis
MAAGCIPGGRAGTRRSNMSTAHQSPDKQIAMTRVLHVLRAPVGGLFRHVRDLVPAQRELGIEVGVVVDSKAADRLTEERLVALEQHLSLGLARVPMSRAVGFGDASAYRAVLEVAERTGADVLHGHGAKGGAYARLASSALRKRGRDVASFYTPHGGSLNYAPASLTGRVFMALERRLARLTTGIIFESEWSARAFRTHVAPTDCAMQVIPNGLLPADFTLHRPAHDAVDVAFVGELRHLKGIDVLLEALALVRRRRAVRALIVGDGPDRASLKELASALGLAGAVEFPGAMPARQAFDKARVLAIPSRKESFPYIVLEAAAAGIPVVTTTVGGIPEIVRGSDTELVRPDDAPALASALLGAIEAPAEAVARALRLRESVQRRFTVERMARDVVDFYASARERVPARAA